MTLFINVIHNHEKERLEYLQPILSNFAISIPVKVTQISEQILGTLSVTGLIRRKASMQLMRSRWRRYAGTRSYGENLRFIHEAISVLKILFSKNLSRNEKIRAAIEDAVSRKHYLAIKKFCEVGKSGDYVLILESDAHIPSHSYLSRCIDHIATRETKRALYLMTFPFSVHQMGLDESGFRKEIVDENTHLVYPKPFLNTTAAYLMSYDLAQSLLAQFDESNSRLLMPADFLMNHYFINIWKESPATETFVFVPSPIENGSLTGIHPSTIHLSS